MTYQKYVKDISSILVTGGAGYVGSVLVKKLLESGYQINIIDSLIYGDDGISELVSKNKINLIHEDIRNESALLEILSNNDCVVHLAAIVGEPLCKKIPEAALQINQEATKKLVDISKKAGVKRFIFASTCSNYGSSNTIVNEESPVQPLSLYSETKVNSEKYVIDSSTESFDTCVLRFATAYGLSPRMRFDLLLQEFLRDALIDKKISIFGADFWRPLINVNDMADACQKTIESDSDLISSQIFNVGDDSENYTKRQLAEIIKEFLPSVEIDIVESKQDPRNYKVSFEKIKTILNFQAKRSVRESVEEILSEINSGKLNPTESEFSNMSKMTQNVSVY